jgi:peroxiredoxin Q/BCP
MMKIVWFVLTGLFMMSSVLAESVLVGQLAPEFKLPDQQNKFVQLSDFRGQWVVLYFYPKDGTPGCTKEACSFRDNITEISAKNGVILGVSVDDSESHTVFVDRHHLPFKLLTDKEGKIAEKYGALRNLWLMKFAKRHSFIIDPEGRIVKIYRKVDPATHVSEIVSDLDGLQSQTD